jgi:hypothetical protein
VPADREGSWSGRRGRVGFGEEGNGALEADVADVAPFVFTVDVSVELLLVLVLILFLERKQNVRFNFFYFLSFLLLIE